MQYFAACRQIAAQVVTFMLADYETTSAALAYCVYLLTKHPEAQRKLLQEVDGFQGKPSYEELDKFPYTTGVLNEALRLLPPATLTARTAMDDVQVHLGILIYMSAMTSAQGRLCREPIDESHAKCPSFSRHEVILLRTRLCTAISHSCGPMSGVQQLPAMDDISAANGGHTCSPALRNVELHASNV